MPLGTEVGLGLGHFAGNLLQQISRLSTITVKFDVKRRSLTLVPVSPKPEVVSNGQWWDISPYVVFSRIGSRVLRVRLCGFCHISSSGLGVGASRASFIAVFGQPFRYK